MNKKLLYFFYFFIFCILLVLFILFIPGPLKRPVLVDIQKGDTAFSIANKLSKLGAIRNKFFLAYTMRFLKLDKRIAVGEFQIKKGASLCEVISTLIDSKKLYFRKIVVPEGYTVAQIYALLEAEPFLTGKLPCGIKEGSLMPDTYYYYKGESRASIINRMRTSMISYVNALWQIRDYSLPYNSKEDAIILASIVEKETGSAKERALIAGVFLNRLKLNMRLQSDPTVAYGLKLSSAKELNKQHLRTENPYNTYRIKGLPIGAIANPGKAALNAVFYPEKTKYIYFVADGNGTHKFSETLEDHNKNVAEWLNKIRNNKKNN